MTIRDPSLCPEPGPRIRRLRQRVFLAMLAIALVSIPASAAPVPPRAATPAAPAAAPAPRVRQLHYLVTVEAEQSWHKNDPKYPGEQWSKATTKQRYEVTTRLRSDGELQLRNLNDFDPPTRFEAKTIFLARQAAKAFAQEGKPFHIPHTEAEKAALSAEVQAAMADCKESMACRNERMLRYAAIYAVIENPQALEPDTEPGTYDYFLPYPGCLDSSRVTLEMQIDGVRFNKTQKEFVPFSEHHSADTVNGSDGLALCKHYTAVIDTQDKSKPMYLDNVFVPRPIGTTTYTEGGHTSTTPEPQPMPGAAIEWVAATLRHAAVSGKAATTVPLSLSLNGNSTWLGLWTGTAKVEVEWSFTEVPPGH
ncbi:MAG: hypothetical protein NVS9B10_00710 [Nevskia sp.]